MLPVYPTPLLLYNPAQGSVGGSAGTAPGELAVEAVTRQVARTYVRFETAVASQRITPVSRPRLRRYALTPLGLAALDVAAVA